jgi:hypothetical protein
MTIPRIEALEAALGRVLAAHRLVCGAVISSDGQVLVRVGDYGTLRYGGLASALLGPLGSAKATFEALDGQVLPKLWAQGEVFAFLDKHGPELAVVVFSQGTRDVLEQRRLSKRVGETIAAEFAGTE